ncbi:MAG TPA: coiled-coil protein [Methanosarcinales archaeon]|nr:phosphoserine phosphatase [ANME-2 cluster archaeon]HIH86591.1 coiled-coil protein [Methanosarcinales archaeon]
MLQELQTRKADLSVKSEENKEMRNKLNTEASTLASKRNELNKRTKELIDEAQELKNLRDTNNTLVSENKAKRDEVNEKASKVYAQVDKLRKDLHLSDGPSLKDLKKEIDHLEFEQMTRVMDSNKERELVEKIGHLIEEFKSKKDQLESNLELKTLLEEAQKSKDEASVFHEEVKEYAEAAQEYHEKMIQTFKEADKIRAESDKVHKDFVKIQESADEQHRLFIKTQKEIRDFDKLIIGLKRKGKKGRESVVKAQAKKEAEEIYSQFKLGEKISTEDLFVLQRSGLL